MSRPDVNPERISVCKLTDGSGRLVARERGAGLLSIEDEYIRADEVERMIADAVAAARRAA